MQAGGAEMVAVEGAGEVPGNKNRQTETEPPEPALSGARPLPDTARARSS